MDGPRERVRVVIVDDHEMLRRGLAGMLGTVDWIDVVGEATGCESGLAVVLRERPDVLLLDLAMPKVSGLECLGMVVRRAPSVATIILTGLEDRHLILDAIRGGAAGYLLKSASIDQIASTVAAAARGDIAVDLDLLREALATGMSEPVRSLLPAVRLTPREREVLVQLADGLTNKEIGARLAISEDTVKKHVQGIIWKLGVADRTQAAILALRMGLLGPSPSGVE